MASSNPSTFYAGPPSSSSSSSFESASDEENCPNVNGDAQGSNREECSTPRKILKNINNVNTNLTANNNGDNQLQLEAVDTVDRINCNETPVKTKTKSDKTPSQAGKKNGQPLPKLSTFRDIRDLTKLDCITLENVLECLRERYRCHQYYTYAGPVLLSFNSCVRLPRASLIEDVARMSWYFVNADGSNETGGNCEENERAPHVYDIGRRCLKNVFNVGSHQIILISGETGAGKTTATQQLIKYLTENNSRNFGANFCSNLDKKIYFATVILESFGNAKTQANPNSSRFGRLVQLNYSKRSGQISGAEIQTYLLEKHRVAKYDPISERSFHIFYYLLHCLRHGTIEMPNDLTWKVIKSASPIHMVEEAAECEDDDVQRLQNAVMAFNMDDFSEVVNILFAIMALLNIVFIPDCDSSSEDEHFSSSSESPYKTEFTVADWKCARLAADLLCVAPKELVDILIARKITAGSSHRHSIFRKPCERASECEERLQALTSFVYDRIFSYVLEHLNSNLKGELGQQDVDDLSTVSLLDLYGFENFKVNHLEQICINYANERLQQINISIVKSYYEQSIPPDEVMIPPTELIRIENELDSRLQELHTHVFGFLDEECLLKRISEDKDVLERMRLSLTSKKSRFIQVSKPHEISHSFKVLHYATAVDYKLKGLVPKNNDHIPPEFQDILKSSGNAFVQNLFKFDLIRSRNASGQGQTPTTPKSVFTVTANKNTRGKTILTRFKASVDDLMSRLKAGENKDVHFIRCIRPNHDLLAGNFSKDLVEKQLHTCGIADVVKIAGNGFPIRIPTSNLSKDFPKIMAYFCNGQLEPKRVCLIFSEPKLMKFIKFGKSVVFMSENCWKGFKRTEKFLVLHHARVIQKAWKSYRELKEAQIRTLLKIQPLEPLVVLNNSNDVSLEPESDSAPNTPESVTSSIAEPNDALTYPTGDVSSRLFSTLVAPKKLIRPALFFGNGIASRQPVHTLPIKFYTKKTCLRFAERPPRRLLSNGITDAFEDYGIVIFKT